MKKYIRYIFSLLCCIALSTTILITASAHPGGTNADGGHWDYDAGEYHYHHGYPAHDHYDSNGDGIADCPYDFDDQTGINSGSPSSGGNNSRSYSSYDYDPPETITVYKDREVIKEVPVTPTWIKIAMGVLLILLIVLKIKKDSIKKNLDDKITDHDRSEIENQEMLTQFNADAVSSHGESYLYRMCGTPRGDYLGSDNLPAAYYGHEQKWGEKYTFYLGGTSSRKFHKYTCRYAMSNIPVNAYTLMQHKYLYEPCSICRPVLPEMAWVPKFIKYKKFLAKYSVDIPSVDVEKVINSKPSLGEITNNKLESQASEMGISSETLLKIINQERAMFGFPPYSLEQLRTADFERNNISNAAVATKIRKPKSNNSSLDHPGIKINFRN